MENERKIAEMTASWSQINRNKNQVELIKINGIERLRYISEHIHKIFCIILILLTVIQRFNWLLIALMLFNFTVAHLSHRLQLIMTLKMKIDLSQNRNSEQWTMDLDHVKCSTKLHDDNKISLALAHVPSFIEQFLASFESIRLSHSYRCFSVIFRFDWNTLRSVLCHHLLFIIIIFSFDIWTAIRFFRMKLSKSKRFI